MYETSPVIVLIFVTASSLSPFETRREPFVLMLRSSSLLVQQNAEPIC